MVRASRNASNARRAAAAGDRPVSPLSELSDAEIKALARQLRAARAAVIEQFPLRNAGQSEPAHPPFDGQHSHPHGAYGHDSGDDDGQHEHPHEHHGDADHDHAAKHASIWPPEEQGQSAQYKKHVRLTRDGAQVLNTALDPRREAAAGDPWQELARLAASVRFRRPIF